MLLKPARNRGFEGAFQAHVPVFFVTVAVTVAETVAEAVTVVRGRGIVLVILIQALFPHHTPPKGLDAPLMSPMTSRTGPRGRSETTFFDRFILRAVTSVTAR